MTLKEASELHGVTAYTLRKWARLGILEAEKRGTEVGRGYWWVTGPVPERRKRGRKPKTA